VQPVKRPCTTCDPSVQVENVGDGLTKIRICSLLQPHPRIENGELRWSDEVKEAGTAASDEVEG
jgi:hypothetical protein